jgi:hypothetical protein
MTKDELRFHCESQVAQIETWAEWKREKPHGRIYEEHKFILELLDENKLLVETLNECSRKRGKWIPPKHDDGMSDPIEYQVRCSVCGFDIDPQTYAMEFKRFGADKYCPKCGCRMESGE